jgi:hypothetical protein
VTAVVNPGARDAYTYFVTVRRSTFVEPSSAAHLVESLTAPPAFATRRDLLHWLATGQHPLPSPFARATTIRVAANRWSFAPFEIRPLTLKTALALPSTPRRLSRALDRYYGAASGRSKRVDRFVDYAFLLATAPLADSVRRAAAGILEQLAHKETIRGEVNLCIWGTFGKVCVEQRRSGSVKELRWWMGNPSEQYPDIRTGRLIQRDQFGVGHMAHPAPGS